VPESNRVAYFVSRYPARSHTSILSEIITLRSLGFDIQVIAIRGDDRPQEQATATERLEQERTFTVLPFGRHFLAAHLDTVLRIPRGYLAGLWLACNIRDFSIRSIFYRLVYFAEAVVAGRAARQGGCSHIHSHFSSTVALIASRIFNLDMSITIHGPGEFRDRVAFQMREKVARSKFVSAISDYARGLTMLSSDPADWHKIKVCRLGVDPSLFAPAAPRRDCVVNFFRVICVGRLAPVKAQQLLIAACARLVSAGWNLQLRLVGSGTELGPLQRFATASGVRERVLFEGGCTQDELIALYKQSDVFALASFEEGLPMALMEAMAMEIPCVATWVNGIPELIYNNKEGLLVAPGNVEGLANAIESLLKDPDLRRRLGKAGRRKVLQDYNLGNNAAALAQLFQRHLYQECSH
jgi:colanic acid/amylovoran biosynthesis glycosyltransferase